MSEFITLTEGSVMTARYRQYREVILANAYKNQNILPICETFDKTQIETLLGQSNCTQLRLYYGMDDDYKVHLIVVGANADEEDLLPSSSLTETEDDQLLERANRCPDFCPPDSPLNS